MPPNFDRRSVESREAVEVAELLRLADEDWKPVRPEPISVPRDGEPVVDLTLDAQRQPVDELGSPRAGRHDDSVEFAQQRFDGIDVFIAPDLRDELQHCGDGAFGVEDARLAVEDGYIAVARDVSAVTLAQLGRAQHVDVEAVLLRR